MRISHICCKLHIFITTAFLFFCVNKLESSFHEIDIIDLPGVNDIFLLFKELRFISSMIFDQVNNLVIFSYLIDNA